MAKRPTEEQFEYACEWLTINEGDDGEAEACHAVADWLRAEMERYFNASVKAKAVRELAKKHGVTEKVMRAALRRAEKA